MSEGEGAAPAEAGTTAGEDGTVADRPGYVPEKFWNGETGEVRLEDAFKSYSEIEKKGRQRSDKMREDIMGELELDRVTSRPESADDYELTVPEHISEQFGEGESYEFDDNDPLLNFWKETSFELGFSQEEFNTGIEAYMNAQMGTLPDLEGELVKLGENGADRASHVAQWAEKTFSPETYQALQDFATTSESIVALEEIMGLANEPAFIPSSGGDPDTGMTLATLKGMQSDPRYHDPAKYDPEFVDKVNKGFERLFPE